MKKAIKLTLCCLIFLVLLVVTTQPTKLPSAVLILPFLLLYTVITLGIAMLIGRKSGLTTKNLRAGMFGAALPVLLLVLQSLGQLTVRDVLIICVLFGLTYFYVSRVNAPVK